MIVTVTMNPAIDKTVEVDELRPGGLNRIKKVEYDAGGKGINVSKTIRELGGQSVAVGFLGGNAGKTIENVLKSKGISSDFIWVDGETRTNTKVFQEKGGVTELNEPGPAPTEEDLTELLKKIEKYAKPDTLFVLSGSVPSGVDKGIYGRITELVHEKGAKVLLDADGELFRRSLAFRPDIMKPNREELAEFAGMEEDISAENIRSIAEKFQAEGTDIVAVSMGKDGAMLFMKDYKVKCPAVPVKKHSTVGAGDAMVAGLAYAWEKKLGKEETVRLCMAVSAGAVSTIGTKPPAKAFVDELIPQVEIEEL